jgi:methanethiol S-methyltransferase
MLNYYILLSFSWIIYFCLHSILASYSVKMVFQKKFAAYYKYYRLCYNLFSTAGLFSILFILAVIPPHFLFSTTGFTNYFSLMTSTFGVIIIGRAFKNYNMKEFIGLADPEKIYTLKVEGINSYVRHPLYLGTILLLVGWLFYMPTFANLLSFIIIMCYLPIGIQFEEKKLIKLYGVEYVNYQKDVSAVFPLRILKKKLNFK